MASPELETLVREVDQVLDAVRHSFTSPDPKLARSAARNLRRLTKKLARTQGASKPAAALNNLLQLAETRAYDVEADTNSNFGSYGYTRSQKGLPGSEGTEYACGSPVQRDQQVTLYRDGPVLEDVPARDLFETTFRATVTVISGWARKELGVKDAG